MLPQDELLNGIVGVCIGFLLAVACVLIGVWREHGQWLEGYHVGYMARKNEEELAKRKLHGESGGDLK